MRKTLTLGTSCALFFAMIAPSFAHWGPATPLIRRGGQAHCQHDHSGFDWRKVRLRVIRYDPITTCEPHPNGVDQVCWQVFPAYDDAEVKNVTGNAAFRADIFLFGFDASNPRATAFLPWLSIYQDVANNDKRFLSSIGRTFWNLEASCQTSNNM